MSNRHKPPGQGQGKPQGPHGISGAELGQLKTRVEQTEKLVREHLAEKNQWNAEVRNWIGKMINIHLTVNQTISGKLLWVDRYTMCVLGGVKEMSSTPRTIIVHKGAVVYMFAEEETPTPAAA